MLVGKGEIERFDLIGDEAVGPVELLLKLWFGAKVPTHGVLTSSEPC